MITRLSSIQGKFPFRFLCPIVLLRANLRNTGTQGVSSTWVYTSIISALDLFISLISPKSIVSKFQNFRKISNIWIWGNEFYFCWEIFRTSSTLLSPRFLFSCRQENKTYLRLQACWDAILIQIIVWVAEDFVVNVHGCNLVTCMSHRDEKRQLISYSFSREYNDFHIFCF